MGGRFQCEGQSRGVRHSWIDGGSLNNLLRNARSSAQVKSAILLRTFCRGETSVIEPAACRITPSECFRIWGLSELGELTPLVAVRITLHGPQTLRPVTLQCREIFPVPPSGSWQPGQGRVRHDIASVGLNPTRTGILAVLQRMGAKIEITPVDENCRRTHGNH